MNLDITLGQILAAALPTGVAALIGYFARQTLERIDHGIEKVNGRLDALDAKLDDHNGRLVRVETELARLDRDVQDLRKAQGRKTR